MKNIECETVPLSQLRPTRVVPKALPDLVPILGEEANAYVDVFVAGVTVDSKDIAKAEAFVAIAGAHAHGARFAKDAQEAGASVIVTDEAGVQIAKDLGVSIPVLAVANPRATAGILAAEVYDHPDRKLQTFAVTGTNGKTTTTFMLRSILETAGCPTALIGTVEMKVGKRRVDSVHTTTEAPVTFRILALAVESGMKAAIVETSSHALSLHRVEGIHFDVAGFTNLQRDHLDFHGTMEDYLQAKALLFTKKMADKAVICVDDKWGQQLASQTEIPYRRVSSTGVDADFMARDLHYDTGARKQVFTLVTPQETTLVTSSFSGSFNVQNAMVAMGMALSAGIDIAEVCRGLDNAQQIPGRMQKVVDSNPNAPLVIVDYAHTPEALETVLTNVRAITAGKLHIVFGSDGDRDPSKRPTMGQIAAQLADILWLTDENPRSEDPQAIRNEIRAGIALARPDFAQVNEVITCRRDAVRHAILAASADDLVIITGKGAEPYQEVQTVYHRYSDVQTAQECLEAVARQGAGTAK